MYTQYEASMFQDFARDLVIGLIVSALNKNSFPITSPLTERMDSGAVRRVKVEMISRD